MEGLRKFVNLVYFDGVKFKKSSTNVNSIRYICFTCQKESVTVENDGKMGNNEFH